MYDQPMTTEHPGCVLFLIDQSGSMDAPYGRHTAADGVADALNRLLSALVARCRDGGKVRDSLHVGAIGYGGNQDDLLGGRSGCRPISKLPRGRPGVLVPGPPDGHGRLVKKRPWPLRIWVEPESFGDTPMCRALRRATKICQTFVDRHQDSYPPIVVNLTDGDATDGKPRKPAAALTSVSSRHGAVLLVNLHLSEDGEEPVEFPAQPPPDREARDMFEMSSVLPDQMHAAAARMRRPLLPGARGFAYNAPVDSLARLLDIGLPTSLLPTRRRTR